jgi:hypothetical protein
MVYDSSSRKRIGKSDDCERSWINSYRGVSHWKASSIIMRLSQCSDSLLSNNTDLCKLPPFHKSANYLKVDSGTNNAISTWAYLTCLERACLDDTISTISEMLLTRQQESLRGTMVTQLRRLMLRMSLLCSPEAKARGKYRQLLKEGLRLSVGTDKEKWFDFFSYKRR